jgi:hypothetical protein
MSQKGRLSQKSPPRLVFRLSRRGKMQKKTGPDGNAACARQLAGAELLLRRTSFSRCGVRKERSCATKEHEQE